MYSRPHLICVAASVCQSGPALAILEPGSACGMPYAPSGFAAVTLQPLSWAHSGSRQENWLDDQPNEPSIASAICCGEPEAAGGAEVGDGDGCAAATGWAAGTAEDWAAGTAEDWAAGTAEDWAAAIRAAAAFFAACFLAVCQCASASSAAASRTW